MCKLNVTNSDGLAASGVEVLTESKYYLKEVKAPDGYQVDENVYEIGLEYFTQYDESGSQIDFLRVFAGMDVKEAVFWLLDFTGYKRLESKETLHGVILPNGIAAEERKEFVLPEYAGSNAYLYDYLVNQRGIAKEVVDHFVKAGILYEAKNYHNVVFVGTDASGTPKFASMRGVFDRNGKSFKCDVEGNDKQYGFHLHREACIEIVVFEASIDLLSYMTIYPDKQCDLLALGMVADVPLDRYLKDYPAIRKISFCLDNDEPGQKAEQQMMEKYKGLGYLVCSIYIFRIVTPHS